MKNLKMKLIALGILSTVVISTTPVFAATSTSITPGIATTYTTTTPVIVPTAIIQPSFNYGPNGGPSADYITENGGVIQLGDIGAAVKEIQSVLNQRGYPCGTVDGIFGANTKSAVINFQKKSLIYLTPDGIVGRNTWVAMN
ncbi:MAG: peptidoglycan-binding domain-containing protein [Clostridium sp.]|uniref:peptidoglycan-binding domain-containing protein n=1 Tax=Clostridium sp. TaxID=1506 RepID=UPI003D6CF427